MVPRGGNFLNWRTGPIQKGRWTSEKDQLLRHEPRVNGGGKGETRG